MKMKNLVSRLTAGIACTALIAGLSLPAMAAEAPEPYTISASQWSREDYSQQANPAVFTAAYDRALYNTLRQTLADQGEQDGNGYRYAYTMVGDADYSAVKNLIGRMDGVVRYEPYVPQNLANYYEYPNYFSLSAAMPDNYQAPLEFIQPAIDHANGLESEREKVTYLNDYLCTLLDYEKGKAAGITQTFSQHGALKAACSSYARAFNFLCQAADIPCITISTTTHAWNLVYVDGQWLHVDVSTNDLRSSHSVLLCETYQGHTDRAPEQTAFLKELLVPGSTK